MTKSTIIDEKYFPLRPVINPTIYVYEDTNPIYKGYLKVGYTTKTAEKRISEQYNISKPGIETPYKILLEESAIKNDGTTFIDKLVFKVLEYNNIPRLRNKNGKLTEWFKCNLEDVKNAILSIKEGKNFELSRIQNFKMRPEQQEAVEKTAEYFNKISKTDPDKIPHFLWNAKMRFGKTFASYQLAKKMGWKHILILTFQPAVQSAWEEDCKTHIDFEGWQFISKKNGTQTKNNSEFLNEIKNLNLNKPIICFGSFQDYLGKNELGGIKVQNEWVHKMNWDCVILDEYHYGAWRDSAKELFDGESNKTQKEFIGEGLDYYDESLMPIKTKHYLYLSGTPFRAINSGEFIEEQIFNWTYSDEQKAKKNWSSSTENPYLSLPQMIMMTYQLPDSIKEVASQGEFNEFSLNEFFYADYLKEGDLTSAKFKYESEVQKWLDLIRGSFSETTIDDLKLGAKKPPMPFADTRLLEILTHTVWYLPSVASCYAMYNLLKSRHNKFYHDYKIIPCAGHKVGEGIKALKPVKEAMDNPLKTKTITLTCRKLMTGVTVKPWSGIFMLCNLNSPETYFQAAFRVQSPWVVDNPDDLHPNQKQILKTVCYVLDFAPNRALRQISDYSCRLGLNEDNPEKKVADFIEFLPVLAYDGSTMKSIDAEGILDMAMSGTTATLLARRWESALLVNVDNNTLKNLMNNKDAMNALMNIEGFRTLNKDIETIINKSKHITDIKKQNTDNNLHKNIKKELTEEEKQLKSLRKQVQEKLIKFATRVPIFMYLTDYRERTLKDVITQLEPGLFKKVTGLDVKDFELLVSLNVFNGPLMNDAVYKFKRYEDSSLEYTGINKHDGENIGLFDTVLSASDYFDIIEYWNKFKSFIFFNEKYKNNSIISKISNSAIIKQQWYDIHCFNKTNCWIRLNIAFNEQTVAVKLCLDNQFKDIILQVAKKINGVINQNTTQNFLTITKSITQNDTWENIFEWYCENIINITNLVKFIL